MKWLKKNGITILLLLILLAGLCLLLYPIVSDYWNSFHQSRAIASYSEAVTKIDDSLYDQMLEEAAVYNTTLVGNGIYYNMTELDLERYESELDITGTGIMGYVEIPTISCTLPIYHGSDEAVLQIAVGHLEGTSLPVGGENTHCVLSGHRGLPSAKLFSDIDQLVVGDRFMLRVLDEVLTYEVDLISIVLPDEFEKLEIENGKDLCTLVTCTPYGVNTHRLLVRGHRVETEKEKAAIRVIADAQQIEPTLVAPIVAAPILMVILFIVMLPKKKNKKRSVEEILKKEVDIHETK